MYSCREVIIVAISKRIKALLLETDKKQSDLMEVLDMSSKQSLSNKFSNERWSADDLVRVAEYCGCKLAFLMPDGQKIIIDAEEKEKAPDR